MLPESPDYASLVAARDNNATCDFLNRFRSFADSARESAFGVTCKFWLQYHDCVWTLLSFSALGQGKWRACLHELFTPDVLTDICVWPPELCSIPICVLHRAVAFDARLSRSIRSLYVDPVCRHCCYRPTVSNPPPLTPTWPHLRCDVWSGGRGILRKMSLSYSIVYYYNGAQRYKSSSYRSIDCIELWSYLV